MMARSVSLSDDAFRTLRAEKRPNESDSDVVRRLAAEARRNRKDPMAFLRNPPKRSWDDATFDEFQKKMHRADLERIQGHHPE